MVELTVEKILLLGIGLISALMIGIPLLMNILKIIKVAVNGMG